MSEPLPPPLPHLRPRPLWKEMMDEHEELDEGDEIGDQKIGGWLILFAVGRVLAPLFLAASLWKDLAVLTLPNVWSAYTTPGSEYYQPLWSTLFFYETSGNAILLLFSLVLLGLFFARRKVFPPLMVAYMVVLTMFYWGDFFFCHQISSLSQKASQQLPATFGQTVVALAWVPYFLSAKRVKHTFVK